MLRAIVSSIARDSYRLLYYSYRKYNHSDNKQQEEDDDNNGGRKNSKTITTTTAVVAFTYCSVVLVSPFAFVVYFFLCA